MTTRPSDPQHDKASSSRDESELKSLGTAYLVLVSFLRFVTRIFFRTIEVVGTENIPAEGPVIFTGNHPNSLMDPVLLTTTCGRDVRFAAKDVLFENPVLRWLLHTLGAVPIRRRMDHKGDAQLDNTAAFEALLAILRHEGAFGIFPEGISHTRSELAPLKTGAARIALGASGPAHKICIVPCGLTYRRRTRLRSRVLVQYGQPIVVGGNEGFQAENDSAEAQREASRALTDDIEHGLRALTLNTPDFETLKILDGVRRLYSPQHLKMSLAQRSELTRRVIDHYERHIENPKVASLHRDVEAYLFKLSALGLSDRELVKPVDPRLWAIRIFAHLVLLFVWLPLALPGLMIHAPILVAAVFAGDAMTARKDVRATTKLMVATVLVFVSYSAVVAAVVYAIPTVTGAFVAMFVVISLLSSGWAMIRVLERQSVIRRGVSVLLLLVDFQHQVISLRTLRDSLRQRTLALVEELVDPDLERIVAPEDQL